MNSVESRQSLQPRNEYEDGWRGERKSYSLSVASLTVDQREKRSYLNSIVLGFDATLDLEVAADMATCVVSFRRFAREESKSTEPAPEIISGSLFIQRETRFQRQRYNRKTIRRQVSSDGTARMANVGFILRGSEGYGVRTIDREEMMRQEYM